MSIKNRKSTRLESDQFISYRVFDSEGRVCLEGMATTKDISRDGVAVESRNHIEPETKVELTIALSEELIKTVGIVRNSKEIEEGNYHIGIEFTELSNEEFEKLKAEFPNIVA